MPSKKFRPILFACVVGLGIAAVYLATLQTIPNGASHAYMIDVGETQVALNVWGTLHATGYPLYTILGNLFTVMGKALGLNPAAAASLFSALWTALALLGLYTLLRPLAQIPPMLIYAGILLLAFMRSIWIHSVIAEVYSMSLAILLGLWLLARPNPRWSLERRIQMLALLGGVGVAHHRALGFAAPALLFALWPELWQQRQRIPWLLATGLPLALLGFLPYLYLPLRAAADAEWVYGEVGSWEGFWFLFWGREADYLVVRPDTLQGWLNNFTGTLAILGREMTPPGLLVALAALGLACWQSPHRRLAWLTTLSGLGFFAFAVAYHQAVLPEAILMMTLPAFVVGVVLAAAWLWQQEQVLGYAALLGMLAWAGLLMPYHQGFVRSLTEDERGLASIQAASAIPRHPDEQPVLMLSWGPRYFAASYSRLVTGENADLEMVDHNADFRALAAEGKTLYTEPDTLFGYPLEWWEARLGRIYLSSAAWNMLRLATSPESAALSAPALQQEVVDGIWLQEAGLRCADEGWLLTLRWYAAQVPGRDYSVFVHLLGEDSPLPLAQADARAPVYGWRPTSTWLANEIVQEHYRLPWHSAAARLRFGLYAQLEDGSFQNYGETELALPPCPLP